jgi:hypothetical protein
MVNKRILIRIVFVILIANEIECLGGVCDDYFDDCFDFFNENGIFTSDYLVNKHWYEAKKNGLVLKIF